MTYEEWKKNALQEDLDAGLRLGQSYCNRVQPGRVDPILFYETDNYRAEELIAQREEERVVQAFLYK